VVFALLLFLLAAGLLFAGAMLAVAAVVAAAAVVVAGACLVAGFALLAAFVRALLRASRHAPAARDDLYAPDYSARSH
jgi:hypothetical protein